MAKTPKSVPAEPVETPPVVVEALADVVTEPQPTMADIAGTHLDPRMFRR